MTEEVESADLRTLVLVLGCRAAPYPRLIETIEETWASVEVETVAVLFYYGGDESGVRGRSLYLPVPDDLAHVGEKTIAAFDHVLEHRDFDLVFRTNCSSYVDLPNLREFVRARGRAERFYCGHLGTHDAVGFASGSGYFLSRDLVRIAVEQQTAWDHSLVDDVALGALLARRGIRPEPAPRHDFGSVSEVNSVDTSQFHFRCRTDSPGRLEDGRVIVELHRAFSEARGLRPVGAGRLRRALAWVGGRASGLLVRPGR